MIAAHNVIPAFHTRRSITADELRRLQEPVVIFEGLRRDDNGEAVFMYTVAGWLDGQNIATMQGGATVGGDVILIHARNRAEADLMAGMGLQDTIDALNREDEEIADAIAARERLAAVNARRRIELATASDKNPDFVADTAAIRKLRGDDIVLAAGGGVKH